MARCGYIDGAGAVGGGKGYGLALDFGTHVAEGRIAKFEAGYNFAAPLGGCHVTLALPRGGFFYRRYGYDFVHPMVKGGAYGRGGPQHVYHYSGGVLLFVQVELIWGEAHLHAKFSGSVGHYSGL
jgi:hypothetical protein